MALNFYDTLGVLRDASTEEIKKAYKKAALIHHPDKGGDSEKFKECCAAVETLTDERKRAAYDASLVRARSKDGLRFGFDREPERPRPPPQPRPTQESSGSKPPRPPPRPAGAVEIPSDPSGLTIKEMKELLSALGIDHEGCIEKAELLALLKSRRDRRPSGPENQEPTPRASRTEQTTPRGQWGSSSSTSTSEIPPGTHPVRVKVMSLGSAAVGKSTLIKRYCEGRFVQKYITTIGIDYGVKPVKVLGHDLKVNFFDTSGGDEFKDIRVEFYGTGQTSAVLMVFDVGNLKSFTDLEHWLEEARRHRCPLSKQHRSGDGPVVVLCANKTDAPKRVVSKADGMDFAAQHGMQYFETSAATGENVTEAMNFLFSQVVTNHVVMGKRLGA